MSDHLVGITVWLSGNISAYWPYKTENFQLIGILRVKRGRIYSPFRYSNILIMKDGTESISNSLALCKHTHIFLIISIYNVSTYGDRNPIEPGRPAKKRVSVATGHVGRRAWVYDWWAPRCPSPDRTSEGNSPQLVLSPERIAIRRGRLSATGGNQVWIREIDRRLTYWLICTLFLIRPYYKLTRFSSACTALT